MNIKKSFYQAFASVVLLTLLLSCKPTQTEGYVQLPGGVLYYNQIGKGDPIIVVHGGPGLNHTYLLPQMADLADNNQVTFYDQRCSGKSLCDDVSKVSTKHFVNDIETLRTALGYKKFTLIGHSWGGLLAMNYALLHQDKLSSLILLDSEPATSVGFKAFIKEYVKRTLQLRGSLNSIQSSKAFKNHEVTAVSEFLRTIFSAYMFRKGDEAKLNLTFDSAQDAKNMFVIMDIFSKTLSNYDLRKKLKALRVPTLIISGQYDIMPVWTAKEIHSIIPGSELSIIKNCGHFPYVEQPKEFFRLIRSFLSKINY